MHVLSELHKALRPSGILLDIHPFPEDPRVEVFHAGRTPIGRLDWTSDSRDVRRARRRLTSVINDGWFRLERRLIFDTAVYHDSIDEWLEFRERQGATGEITQEMMRKVRREMRRSGAQLAVHERVRASTLRRMDPR